MKKLIFGLVAGLLLAFGAMPVRAANVDNYSITNYDVKMTLGRDSENRSTLRTVETITAQFPDFDQNHGLERIFVKEYNGHSTSLELVSVTDEKGNSLPYGWNGDALRIGESNKYVHGEQKYVITYTQRDVTRYYADTGKDEFYWDVIGVEWRVPIENAKVVLTVANGDDTKVVAGPFCHQGATGSTTKCEVSETPDPLQDTSSLIYTAQTSTIGNGHGMTLVLGFEKGTFAEYKMSLFEQIVSIWLWAQAGLSAVGVALAAFVMTRWNNLLGRKKEIGTIVPEYLPPHDTSVTTSARSGGYIRSVMTAQLIDLAVRHYIKIYEVKEKSTFKPAEYEIEIIKDISDLKWEEQEILKDTFGATSAVVGQRLNLKTLQNNTAYFTRTLNNDTDLDKRIRGDYGLQIGDEKLKKTMRRAALGVVILGVLTLSPVLLIIALIFFVFSFLSYRLTDKGLELKRYLEGLKMYIGVAEEERIKMLQSPEGAEKVASVSSVSDNDQLVKLYEKVLPYAILFGQEKQWNKQIGSYYEASGSQPDWYAGQSGVFNAVAFSSAMNSFSSASNSASSSSSSSGGSGGGGSAGGGGGGGGGGGW